MATFFGCHTIWESFCFSIKPYAETMFMDFRAKTVIYTVFQNYLFSRRDTFAIVAVLDK